MQRILSKRMAEPALKANFSFWFLEQTLNIREKNRAELKSNHQESILRNYEFLIIEIMEIS